MIALEIGKLVIALVDVWLESFGHSFTGGLKFVLQIVRVRVV